MRKNLFLALAVVLLLTGGVTACKKQQKSEDIIVRKYVPEKVKAPIALSADSVVSDATWQGKRYVIKVSRRPTKELPLLEDERGQKYVDNRISLTITGPDNSVFLTKEFTKESFLSYVESDDLRKKGILETIAFHEVDGNRLKFGVVISRPDNDDLFVPLDMWIDRARGMSIKPADLFGDMGEG